ncbi:MAG: hypothetical protein IT306_09300 [Chloroflexi bacterium]|nr:hypothetical protein [Chloroflexota bacterium]
MISSTAPVGERRWRRPFPASATTRLTGQFQALRAVTGLTKLSQWLARRRVADQEVRFWPAERQRIREEHDDVATWSHDDSSDRSDMLDVAGPDRERAGWSTIRSELLDALVDRISDVRYSAGIDADAATCGQLTGRVAGASEDLPVTGSRHVCRYCRRNERHPGRLVRKCCVGTYNGHSQDETHDDDEEPSVAGHLPVPGSSRFG